MTGHCKTILALLLSLGTLIAKAQVTDMQSDQFDGRPAWAFTDVTVLEDEDVHAIDDGPSHAFFAPSYRFVPDPRRAVIFSAIFPGLGQAYNREFWKIPIVFGGLAGFAYAITWNQGYFRDYQAAFVDIRSGDPTATRWHVFLPIGMNPDTVDKQWFGGVLEHRRDFYRHWRDLSIILTVGFYLLAMVDAYVDARLFNFTMSRDLSMRVSPTMITQNNNSPNNTILNSAHGLSWSFRF